MEKGLTEQIGYLTKVATGQPHEGSTYGAEKVLNEALMKGKRLKHHLCYLVMVEI